MADDGFWHKAIMARASSLLVNFNWVGLGSKNTLVESPPNIAINEKDHCCHILVEPQNVPPNGSLGRPTFLEYDTDETNRHSDRDRPPKYHRTKAKYLSSYLPPFEGLKVPIYQLQVISQKNDAALLLQNRQDAAKKAAPTLHFIMMFYGLAGCSEHPIAVKN